MASFGDGLPLDDGRGGVEVVEAAERLLRWRPP